MCLSFWEAAIGREAVEREVTHVGGGGKALTKIARLQGVQAREREKTERLAI